MLRALLLLLFVSCKSPQPAPDVNADHRADAKPLPASSVVVSDSGPAMAASEEDKTKEDKVGGDDVCPIKIDQARVLATHETSWRGVARTIRASLSESCQSVPSTESAAKDALAGSGAPLRVADKGDFFLVRSGDLQTCGATSRHVVQVVGTDFWVYPRVGGGFVTFGAASEDEVTIEQASPWVHAVQRSEPRFEHPVCATHTKPEELFDCTGAPGEVSMGRAFPSAQPVFTDYFFDPDAHALVLQLKDAASGRVRVAGGVITLEGVGCNRVFSRGDGGLSIDAAPRFTARTISSYETRPRDNQPPR